MKPAFALPGAAARVYRQGRKSFAQAESDASTEVLHETRKQAKYLAHVMETFDPLDEVAQGGTGMVGLEIDLGARAASRAYGARLDGLAQGSGRRPAPFSGSPCSCP